MTDPIVVWVVSGWCGEYSDHRVWTVAAYLDKAEALRHAEKAKARADEIQDRRHEWPKIPENSNEWDPNGSQDYTGTEYGVTSLPICAGPLETWAHNEKVIADYLKSIGEIP